VQRPLGGIAVAKKPKQARFESMPQNALEFVEMDYVLPSTKIGALLGRLANQQHVTPVAIDSNTRIRIGTEVKIAAEDGAFQKGIMKLGSFTPFTCPECHGALVRIAEGKMSRFRCHTGHAYSDNALLEAVMESSGELLWQVIRSLKEGVMLLNHMGKHLQEAGNRQRAKTFFAKAREIEKQSKTFHDAALKHESLSGDNLGQQHKD
jgi:two-component system chemotaxis response regulator CheB